MFAASALLLGFFGPCPPLQDPAPFQLNLPQGYEAFHAVAGQPDAWQAVSEDPLGLFEVRHFLLEAPGAFAEAVAQQQLNNYWRPLLQEGNPRIQNWHGQWAQSSNAAGASIRFLLQGEERAVEFRVALSVDHLILGHWEGSVVQLDEGLSALQSFHAPKTWKTKVASNNDIENGLGLSSQIYRVPGNWEILVQALPANFSEIQVSVKLHDAPSAHAWHFPEGAIIIQETEESCTYRFQLLAVDGTPTPAAGLFAGFHFFQALRPDWLAIPQWNAPPSSTWLPPAWTLSVQGPAHLKTRSWTTPTSESLQQTEPTYLQTNFPRMPEGRAWPFFLIGNYTQSTLQNRGYHLRNAGRQQSPEDKISWLNRCEEELSQWLKTPPQPWFLITGPDTSDWVLPGLLVLDENSAWLSTPLDAHWQALDRRTALARKVAFRVFGLQTRGVGTGAPFLNHSLSEYLTWRLLERTGKTKEAKALLGWWELREMQLPALRTPLSLFPASDAVGTRRLLSHGGRVWRAMEKRAGRPAMDAVLSTVAQARGTWTTEDLRVLFEAHTKKPWGDFFHAHIYGVQPLLESP